MQKKATKSHPENRSITATGVVIPVMWDIQGNPIRVALATTDEQEYVIDRRSRNGREVATLLREQVQIEGFLNEKGSITIKRYARIDCGGFGAETCCPASVIDRSLKPKEE